MPGYRDELEAARARIDLLETEVAELRGQLQQTPAVQARLAELQRKQSVARDALRAAQKDTRSRLRAVLLLGGGATLVFVAAIASMGSSGHPLNALVFSLLTVAPLAVLVALIGRSQRRAREAEVEALDRAIALLLADGPRVAVTEGVRVASGAGARQPSEEQPEEASSEIGAARRV